MEVVFFFFFSKRKICFLFWQLSITSDALNLRANVGYAGHAPQLPIHAQVKGSLLTFSPH